MLTADGLVECQCQACRERGARVSCSEFEEHAGSRERRPAESIFLAALGLSLRVRGAQAACTGRSCGVQRQSLHARGHSAPGACLAHLGSA